MRTEVMDNIGGVTEPEYTKTKQKPQNQRGETEMHISTYQSSCLMSLSFLTCHTYYRKAPDFQILRSF